MIVLDTDHLTEFQWGRSGGALALRKRLREAPDTVATTVISLEEIARGWLAEIRRKRKAEQQIAPYQKFQQLFSFFADWSTLGWTEEAVHRFADLKSQGIRIGTMDLKIASIVLANDAKLLTRNFRDFDKVPGLQLEDWLE